MEMVKLVNSKTDYLVKNVIGKGGFASVFEAESKYEDDKIIYALKVINAFDQTPKYVKREKAINILVKDIRFVAKFYDFIEISEKYKVFVLEKSDKTLDTLVREEIFKHKIQGLSELKAFFFFSQLVHAVQTLHSINIVHRDLKPQNILLLNYMVKICDFTTAKVLDEASNIDFTSLGTASFNSPEGFTSENIIKSLIPVMDIYSLGIILYFMVFGVLPYKIKENDNPDFNFVHNSIQFENKTKVVSKCFVDLFKKLIEIDAQDRFSISDIRSSEWFVKNNKILLGVYPGSKNTVYDFKECFSKIDEYEVKLNK